jgi:hypothetical protein
LFYSLSQAGRAIAAANLHGEAWRLAAHGLHDPPQPDVTDLLRRRIEPRPAGSKMLAAKRRDAHSAVAEAVGCDALTESVELGEVWAAVPDLIPHSPQMPNLDPQWRRPLVVFDEYWDADRDMQGLRYEFPMGILVAGLPASANAKELYEELGRYPAVGGAGIRTDPHLGPVGTAAEVMRGLSPYGQECTRIMWLGPRSEHPRFEDVAPDYRGSGVRVLVPCIAGRDYLAPIMLWWVLLFALSSIARYDPEMWVAALAVDDSKQAVPIEATLDAALEVLDVLILEALIGELTFAPARPRRSS